MAIKLVRNNDGTYEYVDAASQSSKVNNLKNINNDFEAYESNQKTSLNQSTDIGTQTGQLIREMPGQTTTRFNDQTGQFETTTATQAVNVEGFKEPERTAESTALTPMQQVERLTAATRPDSSTTSTDKVYELMARQQKLAEKTQQFNKLYKGADLAFRAYDTFTDIRDAGRLNIVPMKGGSTLNPLSGFMGTNVGQSTVGGVGTAGMAGYGVSKMLGGNKKQNKGAGVGSAIGMAVGGPVGGVVGGVIGAVFSGGGGSVICTELYKQNLMSKEDYKIHWDYTINKWNKDELKGYWLWAMPTAKKMKTSKWLTKFWLHIMKYKIQHVKYTLGKTKFTLKGYIYNLLVEQISLLISKLIKNKKIKEVLV